MQSRRVFVQIPFVCEQMGEFTQLRTTFSTTISFTQHSADWLKMENSSLVHIFFLSVLTTIVCFLCLYRKSLMPHEIAAIKACDLRGN